MTKETERCPHCDLEFYMYDMNSYIKRIHNKSCPCNDKEYSRLAYSMLEEDGKNILYALIKRGYITTLHWNYYFTRSSAPLIYLAEYLAMISMYNCDHTIECLLDRLTKISEKNKRQFIASIGSIFSIFNLDVFKVDEDGDRLGYAKENISEDFEGYEGFMAAIDEVCKKHLKITLTKLHNICNI